MSLADPPTAATAPPAPGTRIVPRPAAPDDGQVQQPNSEPELPATAASATRPAQIIELQGVSFFYGTFRAVKEVGIAFEPRRITALIGPSGCGKSTLLRTINRMNDLIAGTRVEGRVMYHGQDLYAKGVDPVEVRRRIGLTGQYATVDEDLTGAENLVLFGRLLDLPTAEARVRAARLLDRFGLTDAGGRRALSLIHI